MPKLKDKLNKRIADRLRPILDEVGKQLYNQLYVVRNYMNIDIKDIIDITSDYNSFWEVVAKYYNDYVDTTELEEE